MRKIFTQFAGAFIMLLLSVSTLMAQSVTISGTVTDKSSKETLPGVSVTVKGKTIGASTNGSGKFSFTTTQNTPFTVVVSYLGYKTVEATVSSASRSLSIELEAQAILGQEVVVAASRTPEKILESPVSIIMQAAPLAALIPLLIMVYGVQLTSKVFVVIIMSMPVIVLNTAWMIT